MNRCTVRGYTRAVVRTTLAVLLIAGFTGLAGPVQADTSPHAPELPGTVSAVVQPAPQVDGVAWATAIVGKTVFVGGKFTTSWAFGKKTGDGNVARHNVLSFDLATGKITNFAPNINGEVRTVSVSPDQKTVYLGGNFTTVDGKPRARFAAFDVATGALKDLAPVFDFTVSAILQHANTMYIGGSFSSVHGQPRKNLAAVDATTGNLLPWAPAANRRVLALEISPDKNTIVAAGSFETLAGRKAPGWGAVHATTGAAIAWPANETVQAAGENAAIYDLASDASGVYGVGYTFDPKFLFEGSVKATWAGERVWVKGCKGDSYSAAVLDSVLYTTHHHHDCEAIDGIDQREPWLHQRADAVTTAVSPFGRVNTKFEYNGDPAPEPLHWWPEFVAGKTTGLNQAAWGVAAADGFVVMVGEFPWVNNISQRGIAVFAKKSVRSKTAGPRGDDEALNAQPTVSADGIVSVAFDGLYDRDSYRLRYELLRNGTKVTEMTTEGSTWWTKKGGVLRDVRAQNGSNTYQVRVVDPEGNEFLSQKHVVDVTGVPAGSRYAAGVKADQASHYWQLGEAAASSANDSVGSHSLRLGAGVQRDQTGVVADSPDKGTRFTGAAGVPAATTKWSNSSNHFAMELWVKTSTTSGGALMNFGSSQHGHSFLINRMLYLCDDGRVHFTVQAGKARTLASVKPVNDGSWHHIVANVGTGGMELFVDGARVAHDKTITTSDTITGFWRIAGDTVRSKPDAPTSANFTGTLDEVAVYPAALSAEKIRDHYQFAK